VETHHQCLLTSYLLTGHTPDVCIDLTAPRDRVRAVLLEQQPVRMYAVADTESEPACYDCAPHMVHVHMPVDAPHMRMHMHMSSSVHVENQQTLVSTRRLTGWARGERSQWQCGWWQGGCWQRGCW